MESHTDILDKPHEHQADATFFTTQPGDNGFCRGKVLKFRMKGREFHWARVGICRPTDDGYFEIRVKPGTEYQLVPPTPHGVHDIYCEVDASVPQGAVIKYSLWQVIFEDGKRKEKELDDPELEIGF